MNWWIFGGIVLGVVVIGYLLQRLHLIDLSGSTGKKSSAHGGSLMGIGDEVFAPTRYEASVEQDRQTRLPAPAPLAGDGDKGIFNGKISIDVSKKRR